jgi:hypothetical protein
VGRMYIVMYLRPPQRLSAPIRGHVHAGNDQARIRSARFGFFWIIEIDEGMSRASSTLDGKQHHLPFNPLRRYRVPTASDVLSNDNLAEGI